MTDWLSDTPGIYPALLCPAQTQSPIFSSLFNRAKPEQNPPLPTSIPGPLQGERCYLWFQRLPATQSNIPKRIEVHFQGKRHQGHLLMAYIPSHWSTHSSFCFPKKKREKGTVTGICIQNHIWILGKLLGQKLTIESGAGALSKENERKERTIFCSYNGSTVLFVIISYREACTYNQFILESGLKHTNIYTQASSPAMVGNCHLQNWDQYWLCTLKSQKATQALEAMRWATPRIWVWPVGVTLLALPGDMSALQRPGEAIPTQYIHNWGTVSQLAHIITHRHWFVATDFHHCTRRNHCYQEESRWPLTQTHFASKDIFQTQCLSYQICPSRSCVSSQPTWKTMWCDFSSTLRTEVHSHNSHLA